MLISELKWVNNNRRYVWTFVIIDLLSKVECLADVLAKKFNHNTILTGLIPFVTRMLGISIVEYSCYSTNHLELFFLSAIPNQTY